MHSNKSVQIIEIGATKPELKAPGQCFTDWLVVGLGILCSEALAVGIVAGYILRAL